MSLDVYLILKGVIMNNLGSGIFVRENGQSKEISRREWDEKFPNKEPMTIDFNQYDGEVYKRKITHNLNTMADEAGIYQPLWRPDELGITKASELIDPLRKGLALLESDPERFKKFNPKNGWGDYEDLVDFVKEYQTACVKYPYAEVDVSR